MDIEKLIARLENDEQFVDAIDEAITILRKLEAVVEAAMCIDFDGVANVLEEIALDEGDESIVADIRALENILTEYRKNEA